MSAGLLIVRLVFGGLFVVHGSQKLFGWFGWFGLSGTGTFLEGLGFRPGRLCAAADGLAEFGGGLLLVLGLFGPVSAAAISRLSFQMNTASLPQITMMRAIDAIGPPMVPALHRLDIEDSRAAEVVDERV